MYCFTEQTAHISLSRSQVDRSLYIIWWNVLA